MRLVEEGCSWEPTVEKLLQWEGPQALTPPCAKGGACLWLWAVTSRPEPAACSPELGADVEKSSLLSDVASVLHPGVSCTHRTGHEEWGRGGQVCGDQG